MCRDNGAANEECSTIWCCKCRMQHILEGILAAASWIKRVYLSSADAEYFSYIAFPVLLGC